MNGGFEKGLMAILLLLFAAAIGGALARSYMIDEMTLQTEHYKEALKNAEDAKAAAELRATNTERLQAGAIADAVASYKEKRDADKDHDAAVIADLRNDVTRLRVRTNHPAGCSGEVPGAAAGGPGAAGPGDETLAGPVAARLAGRYSDYNRLVEKLTACQAVIRADRLQPAN